MELQNLTSNSLSKLKVIVSQRLRKDLMNYLAHKDKWLLVFDNLQTGANKKIIDFIDWDHNGHIIFCSQDGEHLPNTSYLSTLDKNDVIKIADNILGLNRGHLRSDPKVLDPKLNNDAKVALLYEELNGYPFLVYQGITLIKEIKGLSKEEYKKILDSSEDKIMSNVKLSLESLTPDANNLATRIALINNQGFSKNIATIITNSKETLDDDLYQLLKLGLISCKKTDENDPVFEMHNVIALRIQKINNKSKNKDELERIITLLETSIPQGISKSYTFRTSETVQQNIEIVLSNAELYNPDINLVIALKTHLLRSYINANDLHNAGHIIAWFSKKEIMKAFELSKTNTINKITYAKFLNLLGKYFRENYSDHYAAISYYNKSKEILDNLTGVDYIKFNLSYSLGSSYLSIGMSDKAQKEIDTMETLSKTAKIDFSDLELLNRIKAKKYYLNGKYDQALVEIDESIKIATSACIRPYSKIMRSPYIKRTKILNSLHRYKEAKSQLEQIEKDERNNANINNLINSRILAQKARTYIGLATEQEIKSVLTPQVMTHQNHRKYLIDSALNAINKSLYILNNERKNKENYKFYEDEELAEIYVIKGDILLELGELKNAIDTYRESQIIYFNIFKNRSYNAEFLSHLYSQGAQASCALGDKFHYTSFIRAQVTNFGRKHKNTIDTINYCRNFSMDLTLDDD